MNLVLFTHPEFLGSQSMPRFAASLASAFRARGHQVEMRRPRARLRRAIESGGWAKWAGYIDQYLLFPRDIRAAMKTDPAQTLYVFCDQALGPWVPYVAHRPHVVHCHDLLALRSALGLVPENPTGATGRIYQRYIRAGFRKARHFVSVSQQTRADLHEFGGVRPVTSEVVYNGLNFGFAPLTDEAARRVLQRAGLADPVHGMLLHVGGGQWYKNTIGVLDLYAAYARQVPNPLPLWMVSPRPGEAELAVIASLPPGAQVCFMQGIESAVLQALYSLARAFLFPSLAEGFGWPIVEAMACGCPVITTAAAPMDEVGGAVAHYLPRRDAAHAEKWAAQGAELLLDVLVAPQRALRTRREQGLLWASRFNTEAATDRYLEIYARVLSLEAATAPRAVSKSSAA